MNIGILLAGVICGMVVMGLVIRAIIHAQPAPIINNNPTATATANGGGGAAVGEPAGVRIPVKQIMAVMLLAVCAYMVINTVQALQQRFAPDIKPIVITAQPAAQPIAQPIEQPAVQPPQPIVTVAPRVEPVVTSAPRVEPVVTPQPIEQPTPAWLYGVLVVLLLAAGVVYGTLAILIVRSIRRRHQPATDVEFDPVLPKQADFVSEIDNSVQRKESTAIWESSVPDSIFEL